MIKASPHKPVLLGEVLEALAPKDGATYVDGTFGAGGYSRALLAAANCHVIAIDRDASTKPYAEALEKAYPSHFRWINGCFGDMTALLQPLNLVKLDGIMLDIGVSSMQLDEAERGFSYRHDGPLDMAMGKGSNSAAELVASASEQELADIFYHYGEERLSRRIAGAVVAARNEKPITRTLQLAEIIGRTVPERIRTDVLSRCFQALRIAVNDELAQLRQALEASLQLLSPFGRLVVVSFHSLEDRIVKQFMAQHCRAPSNPSRYVPAQAEAAKPEFSLIAKKAIVPTDAECRENPRARSAKLRAMMRLEVVHA